MNDSRSSALVLATGLLRDTHAKTTHALVRGPSRYFLAGVVDASCAGEDAGELLDGQWRNVPIFASVEAALETEADGAIQLAERVREELKARVFETELGKLQVTTSLGVAQFPDDARSGKLLFDLADKALYTAKQTGRDRVCTTRRRATA